MVWDVILGFGLLVIGSYIGTTLALRGFFDGEYDDPRTELTTGNDGPANAEDPSRR